MEPEIPELAPIAPDQTSTADVEVTSTLTSSSNSSKQSAGNRKKRKRNKKKTPQYQLKAKLKKFWEEQNAEVRNLVVEYVTMMLLHCVPC